MVGSVEVEKEYEAVCGTVSWRDEVGERCGVCLRAKEEVCYIVSLRGSVWVGGRVSPKAKEEVCCIVSLKATEEV